jgi:hypothetical protein
LALFYATDRMLVVVEAKAFESFKGKQLEDLKKARRAISQLYGDLFASFKVYPLHSSRHQPKASTMKYFDMPPRSLTWAALASAYGARSPSREVYLHADEIHRGG